MSAHLTGRAPQEHTTAALPETGAPAGRPWVREPCPVDRDMIAELAPAALAAAGGERDASQFADAACANNGHIPVPHGTGRVLIGGLPETPEPAGLLYLLLPLRLITAHSGHGPPVQARLATELRGIELLATAPHAQRAGVGSALLHAAHALAADDGVRVLLAKIAARDFPVLRWWRHRGYTLAQPGQNVRLHLEHPITCHDGHNGYRLAGWAPGRSARRPA
ncbi:GNAT family N-acetyltransferase [Streptomyces sp. NPDC085946]|uniref:GNAT family N-acetyltransferase n=1 Tax=Streptomyces sp. NPDC085946 TaxID=3365744 RepID=UPI0037D5EC8F